MSNIYLETLNIEWGQIDPKHNRRVKVVCACFQIYDEFSRAASKNPCQQFYEALDCHTPSLIQMMVQKRKSGPIP